MAGPPAVTGSRDGRLTPGRHGRGAVVVSRTAAQRTVVELLETGMSGKQAAAHLGVSQQAVSRHRTVAAWAEEEAALPALVRVLDHAHQLSLTLVPDVTTPFRRPL